MNRKSGINPQDADLLYRDDGDKRYYFPQTEKAKEMMEKFAVSSEVEGAYPFYGHEDIKYVRDGILTAARAPKV